VPVYKRPVFRQSSPKLDLIDNINILESSPSASPFYPLHSKSSLVKLETPLLLQVLATSSLLVQVVLSRPVEALTPLPNLKQCIENLQGMELFSKFDICWGYNNICIREGDQWKAAFKTCQGLFRPKVMFFGMSNSPASFQRFMNGILEELYKHFKKKGIHDIWRILQNYMDNCGIGTLLKDFKLHIEIIHFLFDLLAHHGLHLKLSKSIFMQPQMDFLGVRISKEGATVDPAKVAGLRDYPHKLKDKRQVCGFLGVAGYHRMFCPNFSIIAAPLTALTGKDVPFE